MYESIFVVDDDRMELEILNAALCDDYLIECFYSAEEALNITSVRAPDLIISDLNMPDINGYKLIELLRNQLASSVPVLIVSATPIDEGLRESLNNGAESHMSKPVDPDDLRCTIESIFYRKKQQHKI